MSGKIRGVLGVRVCGVDWKEMLMEADFSTHPKARGPLETGFMKKSEPSVDKNILFGFQEVQIFR